MLRARKGVGTSCLVLVPRLLDGRHQQLDPLEITLDVRRKATFIAHITGVLPVFLFDHRLEVVVNLARDVVV